MDSNNESSTSATGQALPPSFYLRRRHRLVKKEVNTSTTTARTSTVGSNKKRPVQQLCDDINKVSQQPCCDQGNPYGALSSSSTASATNSSTSRSAAASHILHKNNSIKAAKRRKIVSNNAWLQHGLLCRDQVVTSSSSTTTATTENASKTPTQHETRRDKLIALLSSERMEDKPLVFLEQIFSSICDSTGPSTQSPCDAAHQQGNDEDVILRLHCMSLLRSLLPLANTDERRPQAIQIILNAMEQNMESSVVHVEAVRCLAYLFESMASSTPTKADDNSLLTFFPPTSDIEDSKVYGLKECLRVLVRSIDEYHKETTVALYGLDIIRRFSLLPGMATSSQFLWSMQNAPCIILKTLTYHLTTPSIQQIGTTLLAWLAEDTACRHDMIHSSNVVQADDEVMNGYDFLATVMKVHLNDPIVQCNAAATLSWLVHAGTLQQQQQQQQRGSAAPTTAAPTTSPAVTLSTKHIQTVLNTTITHMDNPSVFGNCVCILCGLTPQLSTPLLEGEPQRLLLSENVVIQIVLEGMGQHLDNVKVQECCLRLLRFRSPSTCFQGMCCAVPCVMRAMKAHESNSQLQAQACDVLSYMADPSNYERNNNNHRAARRQSRRMKNLLLSSGATDSILKAFKNHHRLVSVQQATIWYLTLLLPQSNDDHHHDNDNSDLMYEEDDIIIFDELRDSSLQTTSSGASSVSTSSSSTMSVEAIQAFGGNFLAVETIWKGTTQQT